jgi:hypothetical protein
MESFKEMGLCYLTFDTNNKDIILFWNEYEKYNDNFYKTTLSTIIQKSEYLDMLQEKNKSIDFFIGV